MYSKISKALCYVPIQRNQQFFFSKGRAFKEFKMPVPWGTIAGKWYAPYNKVPLLTLHGWQDNCDSFQRLIQLLPTHVGILAIDSPGHGLSSHLPPGATYVGIDNTILIRRILHFLRITRITLMGHSLGAVYSFVYALLYPEDVQHLILYDAMYPVLYPHEQDNKNLDNVARNIDTFIKNDALNTTNSIPTMFTISEMQELLYKGTNGSVLSETSTYLLKRNIKKSQTCATKYYFTKDHRVRSTFSSLLPDEYLINYCKTITCPVCVFIATEKSLVKNNAIFWKLVDVMKEHNQTIEYHLVEGTHHVHLNQPELLKDILIKFFRTYNVGTADLTSEY